MLNFRISLNYKTLLLYPSDVNTEILYKCIIALRILVKISSLNRWRLEVPPKKKDFDFEKALTELEGLVEKMEQGNLSLEVSIKLFERGIALTRACQKALTEAEQKVQILMRDGDHPILTDFEPQE